MALPSPSDVDRRLTGAIRTLPHVPALDAMLSTLSRATDHANGWLVLGLVAAVVDAPRRAHWLAATARVAATEATSREIKRRVGRTRPQMDELPALARVPDPLSLPSSHTADAVAAIWAFDGLLPAAGLRALALVQAASRPYLGVHYVGDVLTGVVVGIATARLRGPAGRTVIAAVAVAYLAGRARSRLGV